MSDVNERPLVKLTPEAKQSLTDLEPDIKQADHMIELMKEMGMDTAQLESELSRHKKIRDVLLREFT